MITPKSLLSFLSEAAQSEAAQKAKEMGLTSAGYGNWRDKSGNVVAKTVDGQLVMIDAKADPMARPAAPEEEMPPEEEPVEIPEPDPAAVEVLAKSFSGGRWNSIDAGRKRQLTDRARQFLISKAEQEAATAADMEAQAAAQQPPEPTPEEQEMAAQDAAVQQKNAELDLELKAQSVEKGKLEIQQQKDAIKQSKAMDKIAKKAQSEKDPGSMAQRMANDAEYEAQVQKDGEEALLDTQTEPSTPAPTDQAKPSMPRSTSNGALGKVSRKAKQTKRKQPQPEEGAIPEGLDDILSEIRSAEYGDKKANIKVNPADENSIFVPQPVPDGKTKMSSTKKSPSPVRPLPGETEQSYDGRKNDDFAKNIDNQPLDVPEGVRRADYIFGDSKKTDLIGESAFMQGAFEIMNGNYDTEVLDMVGQPNLSPEDQEKVDSLLGNIAEAIPSKGLGKDWEVSAAKMVNTVMQHMDPNRNYKFGKAGDYEDGMRLTTVNKDMMDFTYDRANNLLLDKMGKEGIREIMGNDSKSIMDHYDPTDVVFFADDAIQPFLDRLESLGEDFDNSTSKNKNQDLFNGIRKLKQEFINNKSLLPISIKKPGTSGRGKNKQVNDPHFIPRNVSGEYDEASLDDVDMNLVEDVSWGFDGDNIGDLTDNFSLGFDMKDSVYSGNRFNMPIINHPGNGPHSNNPFSKVANVKSEPGLSGPGAANAKLGFLNTDWIGNPEVNQILGYNFEEKYGGRDDNLGIGAKNKAQKFDKSDRKALKKLAKDVMNHQGRTQANMKLPKGMDIDSFVDSLINADDVIHNELEGKTIQKGKRGRDDAMWINLDDDQKARVTRSLGSVPDANFRSKVRTKFRQLRYVRLMQELETAGKLDDFGKHYIYRNTMKLGNEYSPYILLG